MTSYYEYREDNREEKREYFTFKNFDVILIGFIIVVLIFLFAVFFISYSNYDKVIAWADLSSTMSNMVIIFIVLSISLFIWAYAMYTICLYEISNGIKYTIIGIFFIILILHIFIAYLTFVCFNFIFAFYVSIVTTFLMIIQLFLVIQIDIIVFIECLLPLVIIIASNYNLWFMMSK